MVGTNMISKMYHHIGHDYYLEVENKDNGWVHSRVMHSKDYNRPRAFSLIFPGVYACPEEDMPGVIKKAESGEFGLWGSDEDY